MAAFLFFLLSLSLLSTPSSSQLDQFIYTGFRDPKTNITLNSAALIQKNGALQLTNDTRRLKGHAFYPSPIQFKNSTTKTVSSFSTCFVFSIHPEYPKLGGHGFAFTVAPDNQLNSSLPSQYLGLLNSSTDAGNFSNHMFAVEFDTVQDFEFGDINDNHVGIDINSLTSNASAAAAYFTDDSVKHDLNLKSGKPVVAWIDYDSVAKIVNVTLSTTSSKPRIPILSLPIDLTPIFLERMYVGFSASTGLLASSHYVLGWSFKLNGESKSLDLNSLPSVPGMKKKNTRLIVSLSITSFVFVLSSILLVLFLVRRYKNREIIEPWELEIVPHRYKYQELKRATKNFKDTELLGIGGFGRVYKGTLGNPKIEVAVKRVSHESKQGTREFVSEISSIGRLRHRNLVQLQGWCRRGGDLLLVYDFMPNGSLDKYLFDQQKGILSWQQRFRILKGVASGLLYLHEGYEQIVLHRDVKASNVLLDAEMNPRLGDFGLAKLYDHGSNPGTTRVVGTMGYLAPELPRTGRATTGSDVYAYGALMLEVVCGRRPIESKSGPDDLVLVDFVWNKWKEGRILEVVDSRMNDDFDETEVVMVLKLGLMCSSFQQSGRPSMRQLVSYLEGEIEVPDVRRVPAAASDEKGFEDYLISYASSSFDKSSTSSYTATDRGATDRGDGDRTFTLITASPLTPLREAR